MIDTIIFDLGGVLIDWNPRYYYKDRFRTNDAMEYFIENITTSEWNEEQDGGRTIAEATAMLQNKHPHYASEIQDYYLQWVKMLNGAFTETVEILQNLINNPNYKVYALTNWSAETWPKALEIFDFLSWFDGVLVSGQENLKKPDIRIFKLLVERYQIAIENSIFIDDNYRNVLASRSIGLKTIHFIDPYQMEAELNEAGVQTK